MKLKYLNSLLALSLTSSLAQAGSYQLQTLNNDSLALAINNTGTVVGLNFIGTTACGASSYQPFYWKNSVSKSLPQVIYGSCYGNYINSKMDINDLDQIVGNDGEEPYLFQIRKNKLQWLRSLMAVDPLQASNSNVTAINNSSKIAGYSIRNGRPEALLSTGLSSSDTTSFTAISFGSLGTSYPNTVAVNDLGTALIQNDGRYGFRNISLYQNGQLISPVGLDNSGFQSTTAMDLNNKGQFIGQHISLGSFFYNGQNAVSLPQYLGANVEPVALNNQGQIVANYRPNWTSTDTLPLILENGVWVDLNSKLPEQPGAPKARLTSVTDIADDGTIIGQGQFPASGGIYYAKAFILKPSSMKRTVVFIYGQTQTGQDMFVRGGIDHGYAQANLGRNCTADNKLCALAVVHQNWLNNTTSPWKINDSFLDWYGTEAGQAPAAQGSALDWTTNTWPSSWGPKKTVAQDGYGEDPENQWGAHYWKLDIVMDCDKTVNGWFELKSFISNGPGWEANVSQTGAPYASGNHFAQCGKLNVFRRGDSSAIIQNLP